MSALFPRWTNTLSRLTIFLVVALPAVAIAGLLLYVRSPLNTNQGNPVSQPVQFDHRHHVKDAAIECRFCHSTVDTSPNAGIPATEICLGCHAQVWNKSPLLEPVRQSYFTNRPLEWNRVHRLPQFVYFNHAIHVNKGVGCKTCHGRVDEMALIEQVSPLTMGWCLDCHRDPAPHLRPQDAITSMGWEPPQDAKALGEDLMKAYDVHARTSCTTCHR